MGFKLRLLPTFISNLIVVETSPVKDSRGAFARFYCESDLRELIGERRILQINHSLTSNIGAVRGMHFQAPPYAEMKLVRCLRGRVWDVAVDLRAGSPTFLKWHAEELSPNNARMMVIPEGFAHGFQAIEPESELLYLHTSFYNPTAERGLRHDDPLLGIKFPLAVTQLSDRDSEHPLIESNFQWLTS
jgi:dTDP-4-dehydrorhamnose 3,5-epimerase